MAHGMYSLKPEMNFEVNPYFFHFSPKSRVQIETIKSERISKSGIFEPIPAPPAFTAPFEQLALIPYSHECLSIVHCILLRACGKLENGSWIDAPTVLVNDNLVAAALHIIMMCLREDESHRTAKVTDDSIATTSIVQFKAAEISLVAVLVRLQSCLVTASQKHLLLHLTWILDQLGTCPDEHARAQLQEMGLSLKPKASAADAAALQREKSRLAAKARQQALKQKFAGMADMFENKNKEALDSTASATMDQTSEGTSNTLVCLHCQEETVLPRIGESRSLFDARPMVLLAHVQSSTFLKLKQTPLSSTFGVCRLVTSSKSALEKSVNEFLENDAPAPRGTYYTVDDDEDDFEPDDLEMLLVCAFSCIPSYLTITILT